MPDYEWSMIEIAHNKVMQYKQGDSHYFAILNNDHYSRKLLLFRFDTDAQVTCVENSFHSEKVHHIFHTQHGS